MDKNSGIFGEHEDYKEMEGRKVLQPWMGYPLFCLEVRSQILGELEHRNSLKGCCDPRL